MMQHTASSPTKARKGRRKISSLLAFWESKGRDGKALPTAVHRQGAIPFPRNPPPLHQHDMSRHSYKGNEHAAIHINAVSTAHEERDLPTIHAVAQQADHVPHTAATTPAKARRKSGQSFGSKIMRTIRATARAVSPKKGSKKSQEGSAFAQDPGAADDTPTAAEEQQEPPSPTDTTCVHHSRGSTRTLSNVIASLNESQDATAATKRDGITTAATSDPTAAEQLIHPNPSQPVQQTDGAATAPAPAPAPVSKPDAPKPPRSPALFARRSVQVKPAVAAKSTTPAAAAAKNARAKTRQSCKSKATSMSIPPAATERTKSTRTVANTASSGPASRATSTSSAAAVPVSRSTSMSGAPLQHSPKAARPVPKSKALTALRHLNVVMEEDRVFFVIDGRVENCATVRDDALLCQHCLLLQTPEHFAVCSGVPLRRPLGHIVHEITGQSLKELLDIEARKILMLARGITPTTPSGALKKLPTEPVRSPTLPQSTASSVTEQLDILTYQLKQKRKHNAMSHHEQTPQQGIESPHASQPPTPWGQTTPCSDASSCVSPHGRCRSADSGMPPRSPHQHKHTRSSSSVYERLYRPAASSALPPTGGRRGMSRGSMATADSDDLRKFRDAGSTFGSGAGSREESLADTEVTFAGSDEEA